MKKPDLFFQYGIYASKTLFDRAVDKTMNQMIAYLKKQGPKAKVPASLIMGETSIANHAFTKLLTYHAFQYECPIQMEGWVEMKMQEATCVSLNEYRGFVMEHGLVPQNPPTAGNSKQ